MSTVGPMRLIVAPFPLLITMPTSLIEIMAPVVVVMRMPPVGPGTSPWLFTLIFPALAVPYIWRLVRLGRTTGGGGDGTPDECWKLGMFYFNPADPAIFVEQRFGIGYTVNFANRATWVFFGVIVALSFSPMLLQYL